MKKEDIYVTGYGGMIGSKLVELGCSRLYSDVTDSVSLDKEIKSALPRVIIHLAGKSNVDFCEDKNNRKVIDEINYIGSMNVFDLSQKWGVPVVFLSSDHIFNGRWLGEYKETATPDPQNYYGMMKLAIEGMSVEYDNVKIIRTSTLFTLNRPSVQAYLCKISSGARVDPPIFIWRSFMHLDHLCESLLDYSFRFGKMPKFLNISGSRTVSWWKFIYDYAFALGMDTSLVHQRFSDNLKLFVPRPSRAGLDVSLSKSMGLPQFSYLDGIKLDA
jgi:dTDP-4-dehydrorhamnose reductase